MSANLFEKAQEYYQNNPLTIERKKERGPLLKQLMLLIETAPFLTQSQKEHYLYLLQIAPVSTILEIKQTLVRQGTIFLRLNPEEQNHLESWLDKASSKLAV